MKHPDWVTKTVVNRLESSRAQRIVWLLEELGLDYKIKLYKRNDHKRAPDELKEIHPFGKSPLVELDYGAGNTKILAESGHIVNYLIKHFDHDGKFKPANEDDDEQIDYYIQMSEGSLQPPLTLLTIMEVGDSKAPFMVRSVVQKYNTQVRETFNFPEVVRILDKLEKDISAAGGSYFVGGKLSAADIMLVYPVAQICFNSKRCASAVDKKKYPNLVKWSENVLNSATFKKSVQKVEEQAKGKYDILSSK